MWAWCGSGARYIRVVMTFGHLLPGGRDPTVPSMGLCSLILLLLHHQHWLPGPSGRRDLHPPTQPMLEKSSEVPWALRRGRHSGNLRLFQGWGQILPWGHLVCLWDGDSDVLCSGQELLCAAGAGQETPA